MDNLGSLGMWRLAAFSDEKALKSQSDKQQDPMQ